MKKRKSCQPMVLRDEPLGVYATRPEAVVAWVEQQLVTQAAQVASLLETQAILSQQLQVLIVWVGEPEACLKIDSHNGHTTLQVLASVFVDDPPVLRLTAESQGYSHSSQSDFAVDTADGVSSPDVRAHRSHARTAHNRIYGCFALTRVSPSNQVSAFQADTRGFGSHYPLNELLIVDS